MDMRRLKLHTIMCFLAGLTVLAGISCILANPVTAEPSTVLLDKAELARAKENIGIEPLKSYFERLSRGDGGSQAALAYLLTGDIRYAETAKKNIHSDIVYLRTHIPYMVNIWILRSPGRVVSAVLTYDMTRDSGVYTDDDIAEIESTLSWCIDHYLNKGTSHLGKGFIYQTDYIPEDMDDWVIANMNIHRLLAVGLYGLVFRDDPRSKDIIAYSAEYFERILSLGSRPGGAWGENPRYMEGVLRELYMLAMGLKNDGVRDFFADERFRVMLGFFAESIPAPGIGHEHKPLMVAADDSHWWENRSSILSWAASRYNSAEPQDAGEWMWCWRSQGAPLTAESLIFVDPSIESVKPSYASYLPGMGYVLMRDRFGEPDETFFFATFGPEYGTANRTMHHAPGHGDFSIIWRGYPLFLTRGCASYVWSRRMRDQVDFARSLVTYDGAGESIAIPEKRFDGPALETNGAPDESLVRDFYPDGVTNSVIAESFEYAAGQVRNWEMNLPAPFNVRHFLFLKPDVFVVWDQVRSAYPLQWNLHLPAETVTQRGNTVTTSNADGVNLTIDFLQDEPLDFTLDWPLESIREDWPVVLSLPWGRGMFVFNALDIARQIIDNDHTGAKRIYENLISYPARPRRIGLIETDGQTAAVLDRLGFSYELLSYDDLAGDISRFDRIVVGHFAVLVRDRDMCDYRQKLWDYVENGGVCYWAYQYAWGWKPGDTSGPGYFPKTLMVGEGTSVVWGEGIELERPVAMHDTPLWNTPNRIGEADWNGWQVGVPDTFKVMPLYPILPNTDRARNIPVYYSDHWNVLASVRKTYNINVPQTRSRFGPYRWLKVHHKPSDDFLAVLRPWMKDADRPSAEILASSENEAFIAQGGDIWRLLIGRHDGISANLTLFRYDRGSLDVRTGADGETVMLPRDRQTVRPLEFLAADALEVNVGGMTFLFDNPATLRYDLANGSGSLAVMEQSSAVFPFVFERVTIDGRSQRVRSDGGNTIITVTPGEYSFTVTGNSLELTRKAHTARIKVVDTAGNPVRWVHVLKTLPGKGRTLFQGATDGNGALSVRWSGDAKQEMTFMKDGVSVRKSITPGTARIVFK